MIRAILLVALVACGGSEVYHPPQQATERGTTALPPPLSDALDACRQHTLEVLNGFRATLSVAPLALDPQLSAFAQQASLAYMRDRAPHAYMREQGRATFRGRYRHENQGPKDGVPVDPQNLVASCKERVTVLSEAFMDKGTGEGHHDAIMDPRHRYLGVGLAVSGDLLWITTDFFE